MLGKVLVTAKSFLAAPEPLAYLRDAGCEVVFHNTVWPVNEDVLIEQVRDIDGLIFGMEPVTRRLLAAMPKLKIIARPAVGYDTVDIAAVTERKIPVTLAIGATDQSVADYAMGFLLAGARGIVPANTGVQAHGWDRVTGTEVWGKTLAIVGLGRIGQALAKRAHGFDMRIIAVSVDQDHAFAEKYGIQFVTMEEALAQADFISLHVPLTPQTANFINEKTIALIKPGAFLINTARGGLIDEAALAAAVQSGHLRGAAVDVLKQQCANSDSPLIGVPGIIVTPHMATYAHEALVRVAMSAAHSVVTVLRGERPPFVVNPAVFAEE